MDRRTFAGLALLILAAGCSGVERENASLATDVGRGARVRIQTNGTRWDGADIGAVGGCMAAMIPEPPEQPVRVRVIALGDVTRMQVSSRYDGLPDANGARRAWAPGADTTGEQWREVALDVVRQKHGNCVIGM